MLPMLTLWTDVLAVPGTCTAGRNIARDFLVVSRNWVKFQPGSMSIHSPTRFVTIIGRTETNVCRTRSTDQRPLSVQ